MYTYRLPTFMSHMLAILFRKLTLFKRSYSSIFFTSLGSIFFCGLAILIQYLMKVLIHEDAIPITFNSIKHPTNELMLVIPNQSSFVVYKNIEILAEMFRNDTGRNPHFSNFTDRKSLNKYMFDVAERKGEPKFVSMGLGFEGYSFLQYKLQLYYNGTWGSTYALNAEVQATRMMWKSVYGVKNDFTFSSTKLLKRIADMMFGQIGPMLITAGLISQIPLIIFQPITDITGDTRNYMESCTLTLFPYWLATFIVDWILWLLISSIVWGVFLIFQTTAIMDNLFNTWYSFVMSGPSFILFTYCISFAFGSAESAPRQSFIILCIIMIVPVIVTLIRQELYSPFWLEYMFAVIPHINLQRLLTIILTNINILKHDFVFYWKDGHSRAYLLMQIAGIPLYSLILFTIEYLRKLLATTNAKRTFDDYQRFFEETKMKHPVTSEATVMANRVISDNDWAVRVMNVSRLFFDTTNKPIPAVNNVTLGVKNGSTFGFLGANGAGKTTLIKMITGMLPPSFGTIEVNGIDISQSIDSTILSICPQFNSHLCGEMTPYEHFLMYQYIYQIDQFEAELRTTRLINLLGLGHYADKPVRELSGGEQRKLAIALSFYGPASIILLDEPTASLDPVARRHVHDLISSYRGEKTFMLCTHLLSEAEALCDMISIMIKGCVYTCGSPQYLSQKFGTEYKIDVGLVDESNESSLKCDDFFINKLPSAVLSILRPKARIYSIPASAVDLADLFLIMEEGRENGFFSYYTCSSSSLERVFMEIVHLSENDDFVVAQGGL